MRPPGPPPPPAAPADRASGLSAGWLFSALAGVVLALVLAVEGWRGVEQLRLLDQLSVMQQHTIPNALQAQRLVRNLETMRLEGERLLALTEPMERLPSMYVIDVIVENPTVQANERVAPVLRQAQQVLRGLARKAELTDADRRQWAAESQALAQLADGVTAASIERFNAEVEQTRQAVDRNLWQLGVSVVVLTVSLLVFVLVLYRTLIRPLRQVGLALAGLRRGLRPADAPPSHWRPSEIGDIHQAMGQLDVLMQENETIRKDLLASANTDSLTGLHNRRHFMEQAHLALARAKRTQSPLTLAIADLDHFKSVNDTLGHAAGDVVLKAVAQRIRGTLRETDIYCRYGGEEFAFVFPDTGLAEASRLANRLRESVAATAIEVGNGQTVPISLSLGLVQVDELALDLALNQADQAMYRAKVAGRNRIEWAPASASSVASADRAS
jgi:diguanylate cyclase (GGDEF)-like protein